MRFFKMLKRNITSVICFLLAAIVLTAGTISYSRYVAGGGLLATPGIGSFSCSATIDGVSASSFTNTAFWGGSAEEDRIAMNALRSLDFTVNNFKVIDGATKVSEVPMTYSLVFTAPKNFSERLAIQLFEGTNTPLLPQIALLDIIHAEASGSFHTTNDASDSYNGTATTPLDFTVTTSTTAYGKEYTATSGDIIIKLTPTELTVPHTLYFRVWDTSKLTSETNKTIDVESGELCPPLEVTFEAVVPCYQITISYPTFSLPAAVAASAKYTLTLAPTSSLEDEHLGGYLVDSNENFVTSVKAGDTALLETIIKTTADVVDGETQEPLSENLGGGMRVYHVGTALQELEATVGDVPQAISVDPVVNDTPTTGTYTEYYYYSRARSGRQYTYTLLETTTDENYRNTNTDASYRITAVYTTSTTSETTYNVTGVPTTTGTITTTTNSIEYDTHNRVTKVSQTVVTDISQTFTGVEGSEKTTVYTTTYDALPTLTYQRYQGGSWQTYTDMEGENGVEAPGAKETEQITETTQLSGTEIAEIEAKTYVTKSTTDRTLTFAYNVAKGVVIIGVKRDVIDGENAVTETLEYPDENGNAFLLYDENGIQKFFLSQCYSKNFPLMVDVLFEQTAG